MEAQNPQIFASGRLDSESQDWFEQKHSPNKQQNHLLLFILCILTLTVISNYGRVRHPLASWIDEGHGN